MPERDVLTVTLMVLVVLGFFISVLLFYLRGRSLEDSLRRIETSLKEMPEIRTLSEKISNLDYVLRQIDFSEAETHLAELKAIAARVEIALADAGPRYEAVAPVVTSGSERLVDLVERKLYNLGYESVVIVSNLQDLEKEPWEIHVEATRRGGAFKGYLKIQNGSVQEVRLLPALEMFP
ncbi:MAG: hypothetical protein RL885_08960 [Planctomycetota bacterium]